MRYKWLSREKRDPSVAPSCVPDVAPAAMPLPAEAREGSSGLVGDICECQLDGDDGDRPTESILSTMTLQSTQSQSCSVPGMDLLGLRLSQTVVKRTHGYPLSALHTICLTGKPRMVRTGTLLSALRVGQQDSAADG